MRSVKLKSEEDVKYMRQAGYIHKDIMDLLVEQLENGKIYNGIEIESQIRSFYSYSSATFGFPFATQHNGKSFFKNAACISVNDQIVHAIPTDKRFQDGDIITIDLGIEVGGWNYDAARTVIWNERNVEVAPESRLLVEAVYNMLHVGLDTCKPGNKIQDISTAMDISGRESGFKVIYQFCGHGIGQELHEPPHVPNKPGLLPQEEETVLRPGMVICLEPILAVDTDRIVIGQDGWTVYTATGCKAAHVEAQVLITETGHEVL